MSNLWEEPTGIEYDMPTGRRLTTRNPRDGGGIWVLPRATDDAILAASRRWVQRDAEEFEFDGHKRWTEKATGRTFKRTNGHPLAGDRDDVADAFFIQDGSIIFIKAGSDETLVGTSAGYGGTIGGRKATRNDVKGLA